MFFTKGCKSLESTKTSDSGIVVASYYHKKFNGRKTASGQKFKNSKMTAAHKTLPFGSIVKVTNIQNNKSVKVRINDRGPFIKGREIDLSKKAFMKISDHKGQGLIKVKLKVISK
ncbi:septal ring lytic transglycosylase RlpA family protein [Myroides sp. LJL119]